jgi:hypothetical protein
MERPDPPLPKYYTVRLPNPDPSITRCHHHQIHNHLETLHSKVLISLTFKNERTYSDNCWWTPPLTNLILPGIMRMQIMNWLINQQQKVKEEPWTAELVKGLEAIAYTNSVVQIIPIHTVKQPLGSLQYDSKHLSFQQLRGFF